ncbi:MAG TPA: hypothetical protein VK483_08660 [Chitinophagaceae bacterium]|nr:hypothetical protein [Chitinophagaceae bacterium]
MKKTVITIFLFLGIVICLHAQKKPGFSSQNYVGFVAGKTDVHLQLQTINGLKWKSWFGGIGAGIDWYYLRSIPVFASVNRSFLQKGKRSLLLSADAGINFPWRGNIYYDFPPYDHKQYSGLYCAGGVGYKFGVGKADNAILMQLGYSFKRLGEKTTSVYYCLTPPCPENIERFDYRLNRVSFRLGWGF